MRDKRANYGTTLKFLVTLISYTGIELQQKRDN
jgi:hypothetical protein